MSSSPDSPNNSQAPRILRGAARLAFAALMGVVASRSGGVAALTPAELPKGAAPAPVVVPHFPDRLHAFVWRNWSLVPHARMAATVGATVEQIRATGHAMGLADPEEPDAEREGRGYLTVIRRNWHLLPYEQLLTLLGWDADRLDYSLREDDFLYIKLGRLKPACEPVRWREPDAATREREAAIARIVREEFPASEFPRGPGAPPEEPPFDFVRQLSAGGPAASDEEMSAAAAPGESATPTEPSAPRPFAPRYLHSYFATYGDPFLDGEPDPHPAPYLRELAGVGVNGVWLQGILYRLAPFPWDLARSEHWEERLRNLGAMAGRSRREGVGLWLYLNEPRAMPLAFFRDPARAGLKGVEAMDLGTLCTALPEVREWMIESVARVCRAAPELEGFFTISASENVTNCWSHGLGANCPRCASRGPAATIADVQALIREGIARAGGAQRLIAWDWGWADAWAPEAIAALPHDVALMSVSEWSLPIERGGVASAVGEYSLSSIGPGPRAERHWRIARELGLPTMAKLQLGTTWELGSVPYVPAVENVAKHMLRLGAPVEQSSGSKPRVDGAMFGWTLGGYPSPNLEAASEALAAAARGESPEPRAILEKVARARFGDDLAPAAVEAWEGFSRAFSEYPYDGGVVYQGPQHAGPSNLLFAERTGYVSTMVGFPYDHLDGWRAIYPTKVFQGQFEKVASGFEAALATLWEKVGDRLDAPTTEGERALEREVSVAEACAIHFRSCVEQIRFVRARDMLRSMREGDDKEPAGEAWCLDEMESATRGELALAKRLFALRSRDSRIGYETSNHYFYMPEDLAEKVLNCRDLLERALPAMRIEDSAK